jgi:U3 small nucleolar RNA-associated protein 21
MSYSVSRSKDWDDVVTAHCEDPFARSWTVLNKKLGNHNFRFASEDEKKKTPVGAVKVLHRSHASIFCAYHSSQSICVTTCGNFCLGSTSTGIIQMWNMQSGIIRRSFVLGPHPEASGKSHPTAGSKKKKEQRSVTGLATDPLNRIAIASTLDGTINVSTASRSSADEHT